jgi:hypothetical protein
MKNKRFTHVINEMKLSIIEDLHTLEKGYGKRKWSISENTGIPIDVLTVLLKQLKIEGKIELIMIWCDQDSTPNGSGYCLVNN